MQLPWPSRRQFLKLTGAAVAVPLLGRPVFAETPTETPLHGLSAFGDLKYPPDFTHFDYASPEAPTGGTFNFQPSYWYYNQNVLTFNTLNSFVRTGDAPPRMEMCFDTLMEDAWDEPDALYGLLAESVTISEDRNSFTFKLRPEARFHDGSPLTAEDVAFSYNLLKEKGHPQLALPLAEMVSAEASGEHVFRLVFSGEQSERTILDVVEYPVFSKASLEGKAFDSSRIEPLLGSGPYQMGRFSADRYIEYDRVEDYWARDLPVRRGLYLFDRIRIDFFRDRNAAFEAFKKGEVFWREEFTSRLWATGYDFPALRSGKVVKQEFPEERVADMQAWALNQRRARFHDARVREAIGLCFDFEWTNRNFFYGLYERSVSPFENTDFKATGASSPEELALLEQFRGQIPEAALGEAVIPPVSDGSGRDRKLLSEARRLLTEAGWRPRGQFLQNEDGERLTVEYMVRDQVFVQVTTPFIENLRAIGIDASIRMLDAAQYQARLATFDFDLVGFRMTLGATPTRDGLELVFHSKTAKVEGSRNLPGTADPAVDRLVELAGRAASRDELITAVRALDRVLRARRDWIPNWYSPSHRTAYWDMFGFKEPKPDYFFPVEALWWYDEEKAKAIGKA
ncbi:extracellular solute-binding protein [Chelativorans salis]|uniref:Extracellular solute-binding protein n=1 Tax=Chelativorans salis TaxID=2978478 RepID=A0ABT2LIK8_9HYPH|nr:extracellular solute-binding protein [Chelativorans sp. EGI FJ00035]MCT7374396.1 extracellular solute-binding protein [Chelativorans sp. EGI FJ00035]